MRIKEYRLNKVDRHLEGVYMEKIVECVPNFSEGKCKDVIDAIINEIRSIEGVTLWDYSTDEDHNRTVVTFVGDPEAVKKAAINSAVKAAELIDMSEHKGEHPRVGAADVIPFVPLQGVSVEECVEIAREVAERLAEILSMPTFLCGDAALRDDRIKLSTIQTVQYEGLLEKINEEKYKPDFGPSKMHEKYGATVVYVRMLLVAFNVNLATDDIQIAKRIAASVRESSGGLKNVKAMGVVLKEKQLVQVSMDMVNYIKTPLHKPYELIKMEAKRNGTYVVGSELIGMVPRDALVDAAKHYLRLDSFDNDQIIEKRLHE